MATADINQIFDSIPSRRLGQVINKVIRRIDGAPDLPQCQMNALRDGIFALRLSQRVDHEIS